MGRECGTAAVGISTFSADFRYLGRDLHPAALGFSTFSADFRLLGRDLHPAATGNLYPFRQFLAFWVEISNRRLPESLPFRLFPAVWVEISGRGVGARVLHPTSHAFNDSNPLNACACPVLHPTRFIAIKKLWLHFLTMRNQSSVIYYYFSTNITGHPNL